MERQRERRREQTIGRMDSRGAAPELHPLLLQSYQGDLQTARLEKRSDGFPRHR